MDNVTKMNGIGVNANRKHKDSVFTLLFSEKKERLISLYNAVSGSNYPNDAEIRMNTLEGALVLNRLNDISFEIDGKIVVLIEYQSTLNQNMPLRCWLYAARVYEKILDGKNIYRDNLIKIPKPEVYVCYNGGKRLEENNRVLKLSDAFETADTNSEYEFTVKVFDVNKKHDDEILQKSRVLAEYAEFIEMVREQMRTGASLNEALPAAVRECIKNDILREFLETHGSEVCNMLYVEFDIDAAKEIWREEAMENGMKEGLKIGIEQGIERGIEQGIERGKVEAIRGFLKIGENAEKIAKAMDLSVEEVLKIKNDMKI